MVSCCYLNVRSSFISMLLEQMNKITFKTRGGNNHVYQTTKVKTNKHTPSGVIGI